MGTFLLSAEHLALLRNANVGWSDAEYGAPEIDPKRPYGNSDVEGDILELLGEAMAGNDGYGPCYSSEQRARAAALHREIETALQVCLITQSFVPGLFEQPDKYNFRSWRRVEGEIPG